MKIVSLILLALALIAPAAQPKLNLVATQPDYGSVAKEIGGYRIKVTNLAAEAKTRTSWMDARPSFIAVVSKADVLLIDAQS